MPYAQLDDLFPDHPKVVGLSDAAFRVHVHGIFYCNRARSDGYVPPRFPYGWHPKAKQAIRELLAAGLWEQANSGYLIHDYLDWNRSRAQIEAFREKQRENALQGAAKRRATGSDTGEPLAQPKPRPSSPIRSSTLDLPADAGETGWKPTPNGWTDTQAALVRKLQEHDPGWEKLTPSALNKLSREFGKSLVTQALQHAWEDRVEAKEAYPLLAAICLKIKENS